MKQCNLKKHTFRGYQFCDLLNIFGISRITLGRVRQEGARSIDEIFSVAMQDKCLKV